VGASRGVHLHLRGYSTHLNLQATSDARPLVEHYAIHYAPALALLTERRTSPGLLLRDRPGRFEIGTEYLETEDDLRSAILFALASYLATVEEVAGRRRSLAPLSGRFIEATERPGLFVAEAAYGGSMARDGRATRLARTAGATTFEAPVGDETAGDRLRSAMDHIAPFLQAWATPEELATLRARVDGDQPAPWDREAPDEPTVIVGTPPPAIPPGPHSPLLRTLACGVLAVRPFVVTWEAITVVLDHPVRSYFVRIPRERIADFAESFEAGHLSASLAARALAPPTGTIGRLTDSSPATFDLLDPTGLVLGDRTVTGPVRGAVLDLVKPARPPLPPLAPDLSIPIVPIAPPIVTKSDPLASPAGVRPGAPPPPRRAPGGSRARSARVGLLLGLVVTVVSVGVVAGLPMRTGGVGSVSPPPALVAASRSLDPGLSPPPSPTVTPSLPPSSAPSAVPSSPPVPTATPSRTARPTPRATPVVALVCGLPPSAAATAPPSNLLGPGDIRVFITCDLDGNGNPRAVPGPGEGPLAGVVVTMRCSSPRPISASAVTGADGAATFIGLGGEACRMTTSLAGWRMSASYPAGSLPPTWAAVWSDGATFFNVILSPAR